MPTYQKCNAEVKTMAAELMAEFESHKPLVEAKVSIDFLFAFCDRDDDNNPLNHAIMHHGARALGLTRNIGTKDRAKGCGDAEILLDGDWWQETAGEEQKKALLDHELHHVALKIVKKQIAYDDLGRPKLKLRKHDIEVGWFAVIAERHGKHSQEQIQARTIMDAMGQFFWPELAPIINAKQLCGKKK